MSIRPAPTEGTHTPHCPGLTWHSFSGSEAPGVAFKGLADLDELTSLLAELLLE